MPEFQEYPEKSSPTAGDFFLVLDAEDNATKKVDVGNLPPSLPAQLANATDSIPALQYAGAYGGFYSPTATSIDDESWLAIQLDAEGVGLVAGYGPGYSNLFYSFTSDQGAEFGIQLGGGQPVYFASYAETNMTLRATTEQTGSVVNVETALLERVFAVGPSGAITTLNGESLPITGVAVTAAGIHGALVTLGLITS